MDKEIIEQQILGGRNQQHIASNDYDFYWIESKTKIV